MMLLAERLGDAAQAKAALQQIQLALDTMHAGRIAAGAQFYEAQLVRAKALVGQLSKR